MFSVHWKKSTKANLPIGPQGQCSGETWAAAEAEKCWSESVGKRYLLLCLCSHYAKMRSDRLLSLWALEDPGPSLDVPQAKIEDSCPEHPLKVLLRGLYLPSFKASSYNLCHMLFYTHKYHPWDSYFTSSALLWDHVSFTFMDESAQNTMSGPWTMLLTFAEWMSAQHSL